MLHYNVICPRCGWHYPGAQLYKPRLHFGLNCPSCNACFRNSWTREIAGSLVTGALVVIDLVYVMKELHSWALSIFSALVLVIMYLVVYPFFFKARECADKSQKWHLIAIFLASGGIIASVILYIILGAAPLITASRTGNTKAIRVMTALGADPNVRNNGLTSWVHIDYPIDAAVLSGDSNTVDLLVNLGVNVNVKDRFGATPLHIAVMQGEETIVDLLLASGADSDAQYGDLMVTPLMIAADNGYEEIAGALIKKGANVSPMGRLHWNMTPLMLAAQNCHTGTVNILLSAGANVNVKNRNGISAIDYARNCKDGEILRLLYEYK